MGYRRGKRPWPHLVALAACFLAVPASALHARGPQRADSAPAGATYEGHGATASAAEPARPVAPLLARGSPTGPSGAANQNDVRKAAAGIQGSADTTEGSAAAQEVDLAAGAGFTDAEDRQLEVALDGSPRAFSTYLLSHYSTLMRLGGSGLSNLWATLFLDDDGLSARDPSDAPEGKVQDGTVAKEGKVEDVNGGNEVKGPDDKEGKGKDTTGAKVKAKRRPKQRLILGLPKLAWALIADVLAMLAFVACIPFVLTVAKRRRNTNPTAA